MNKRNNHILLLALLPLILFFQYGQLSFIHYHIAADGEIITHSHPYQLPTDANSKGSPGHNHSSSELIVLGTIDAAFSQFVPIPQNIAVTLPLLVRNITMEICFNQQNRFSKEQFLRGPPKS